MSKINKRVNVLSFAVIFVFAFAFATVADLNIDQSGELVLGVTQVLAEGDGDGDGGGDGGGYTPPPPPTCPNGATNYPYCNNCTHCVPTCPEGYSLVNNQCVLNTCTNGATNYPTCNNNVCTNGATNYPACNNNHCTNGATNYPYCNNNTCNNGCNNYPHCTTCPTGYSLVNGQCVLNSCQNGATNYPYCNNNVCTNGATNYPSCNNNTCTNGATNFPYCNNVCTNGYSNYPTCGPTICNNGCTNYPNCNTCPTGYSLVNGQCVQNTCQNGATNYPYCNNNVCTNGATNYPLCNNQYVPPVPPPCTYCNYVPPVQYQNLSVSTTGATPLITTATIYGYVNPYSSNASIWFDYGTGNNLQWQTTRQSTSYAGQFSAALSGLTCGTRYYYRAAAQNSQGTEYGSTLSFVTQPCQQVDQSQVITRLATAVGYYSAQLNGTYITSSSFDRSCQAFFDYGTNGNLTTRTVGQTLYNTSTVNYFSRAVSGLTPNTTYYYRAGVTCLDGTKYGNIVTFRTPGYIAKKPPTTYVPPKAVTQVKETATCLCDDDYFSLLIENLENAAQPGKLANFKVTFKNTSKETLQNVAIRVILPEEMTIYSVDKGQYTKGGKTLLAVIGTMPSQAEGVFIITTNVAAAQTGSQMIINAYADYTVPTVVKNGIPRKGEVTAYTMTVSGEPTATQDNNGNVNVDNSTSSMSSWIPGNWYEWIIFIIIFVIFLSALRYVFSVFSTSK